MPSAALKPLSVENLASERLLIWIVLPEMVLEGVSDYEGPTPALMCSSTDPPTPKKKLWLFVFCPGSQRREKKNTKERMCLFNKVLQDEFLLLV